MDHRVRRLRRSIKRVSNLFINIICNDAVHHGLIVLGLIILAVIGQIMSVRKVERMADNWVENIKTEDPAKTPAIPSGFNASESEKARLLEQVKTIRGRAIHHFSVMKFFYSRYYMAISLVLVTGVITAIALFFITKNGWDHVPSQFVKTVFITAAALTVYFGAFPPVFKQSQNIADNKKLYLQYMALHDEVMSYLSVQEGLNGEQKTAPQFIHYLDKQLIELNTFAIGFDDTKIPNYKSTFDIGKQ